MFDGRPGEADIFPLLEALTQAGVEFVIIGGVAGVLLGSPYATHDLDVCAARDEQNLEALARALSALEAREWDPREEAVEREWSVGMLRSDSTWLLTTRFGPLDVLFEPAGTQGYKALVKQAQRMELDDLEVKVASIDDLISMKEAAGRERDRVHLPTLRKISDAMQAAPNERA